MARRSEHRARVARDRGIVPSACASSRSVHAFVRSALRRRLWSSPSAILIFVGPTGYVTFDTHQYSMPPEAIGIAGTLLLHDARVRIVASRFEAVHDRLFERGAKSTLPEHRGAHVAAVSGKRGKLYLIQRQQLPRRSRSGRLRIPHRDRVHRRPLAWNAESGNAHARAPRYVRRERSSACHRAERFPPALFRRRRRRSSPRPRRATRFRRGAIQQENFT